MSDRGVRIPRDFNRATTPSWAGVDLPVVVGSLLLGPDHPLRHRPVNPPIWRVTLRLEIDCGVPELVLPPYEVRALSPSSALLEALQRAAAEGYPTTGATRAATPRIRT